MKKFVLIFVFTLADFTILFAQGPELIWTRALGDSSLDSGSSIVELSNGNLLLAGKIGTQLSQNSFTTDIWLVETDSNGELIESMNYGGMEAIQIIHTLDNGYMVLGNSFSNQGGTWEDILLIKLNENGDSVWTKTIKFTTHDYAEQICQSSDSSYYISVHAQGITHGNRVIKTNSAGDTLWTKLYYSNSISILPSDDGGILISIWIRQTDSPFKMIKLDSDGFLVWEKSYSGDLEIAKLIKTANENLLVASQFFVNSREVVALTKFTQKGDSIYTITIGDSETDYFLTNVNTNPINEIILTGYTYFDTLYPTPEDGFIIKLNINEEVEWRKIIGGSENEQLNEAIELSNGNYIGIGEIGTVSTIHKDLWLVELGSFPVDVNENLENTTGSFKLAQNYPNPFNPITKISWQSPVSGYQTLNVYDVLGNEVATLIDEYKPAGSYEVEWDASNNPSGVYFYKLKIENFLKTMKMVLLK
jgi:hypothetical protein